MAARDRITTLHFAVLGLLVQVPRTGYALRRVFETTPMAHYGGGQGAIYPALRVLQARGLVAGHADEARPGRGARVMRATARGRQALIEWLCAPVTHDDAVWSSGELLLRFAFMDGLVPARRALAFVRQYQDAMNREHDRLKTYAKTTASAFPPCARLAIEHGLLTHAANVQWAQRAARGLERENKAGRTGG